MGDGLASCDSGRPCEPGAAPGRGGQRRPGPLEQRGNEHSAKTLPTSPRPDRGGTATNRVVTCFGLPDPLCDEPQASLFLSPPASTPEGGARTGGGPAWQPVPPPPGTQALRPRPPHPCAPPCLAPAARNAASLRSSRTSWPFPTGTVKRPILAANRAVLGGWCAPGGPLLDWAGRGYAIWPPCTSPLKVGKEPVLSPVPSDERIQHSWGSQGSIALRKPGG